MLRKLTISSHLICSTYIEIKINLFSSFSLGSYISSHKQSTFCKTQEEENTLFPK